MKLDRDLTSPVWIHAKGALFVVLGLMSSAILLLQSPTLLTALLLGLAIWSFCRFYYYLFYVLERYLGRPRPFAGVFDALKYLASSSRGEKSADDEGES